MLKIFTKKQQANEQDFIPKCKHDKNNNNITLLDIERQKKSEVENSWFANIIKNYREEKPIHSSFCFFGLNFPSDDSGSPPDDFRFILLFSVSAALLSHSFNSSNLHLSWYSSFSMSFWVD